jgi:hypothetical protein
MSNIFADCLRHAFSYLNDGGGDPPDPGGGGGGGCEGQENCNDEGDSICDETFTIVRCICLDDGNPITDNGQCGQQWSCVEEGTTATDLENSVEACDTLCEGWVGLPNNGEEVCGFPVVTPGTNAECNTVGCGSQECIFFKCQHEYASDPNDCLVSRTVWISSLKSCQEFIEEGEFLNNACIDAQQPDGCPGLNTGGGDTQDCDYFYCKPPTSNCDQTFTVQIAATDSCPAQETATIQGATVTGFASKVACLNSSTECQGDYDGPTPNFITILEDSFPGIFQPLDPGFFCDGSPINFVDPEWGLINFPDDEGEIFNITDFTFTAVDSQGSPVNGISFNVNGDSATLSFNPGSGNDAAFNAFTFRVQGPGVDETLVFTDPSPSVNGKNCDNYPAQCAAGGLCGYTFQSGDPISNTGGGGNIGGNPAYKCSPPSPWNGTGDFTCTDTATSNDGDEDTQNGVGFGAVFFGSCPTDKCATTPRTFYKCAKFPGTNTNNGEIETKTIELPDYIYNDVTTVTVGGVIWRKSPPSNCNNDGFDCGVYACTAEGCIQDVVAVQTEEDCVGTFTIDSVEYAVGTCQGDPGPCDNIDTLCDSYYCDQGVCNNLAGGTIVSMGQDETCADYEGQDIGGVIIGTCGDPDPCLTDNFCDISYCDEQNNCQTTQAFIGDLYDPLQGGIGFSVCPEDGQFCTWVADANTTIGAIGGTSCPTQCNTQGLPPTGGGPDKSNLDERLRSLSDDELQSRANNFLATLQRLSSRESILDPIGSNRKYFERVSFVPVRNTLRNDIFADYIHCSIAEIIRAREAGNEIPNAAYSNIGLVPLFRSLRRDVRYRLETIKDSRGVPIKNGFLRALKRAIMSDTLDTIRQDTIPSEGYDVDRIPSSRTRDEQGLIKFINEKAKPIDPQFYDGKNKERMRLWKSPAPDLRKAVPLLFQDGTLDYSDVSIEDKFNIVLSDSTLSTLTIDPGDIVKYQNSQGRTDAVDLESDKPKAFMLDRGDYARAFGYLGDELTTKIEVQTPESALIEETYSLDTPRQDIYFMKVNLSSVQDVDSDKKLIRLTQVKYDWVEDEEEIDEFIRYNPWPFENYYIAPEDPFFDHLEYTKYITATFKDISFENLVGYRDDSIIMPRRLPWYIQIIPSDDPRNLLSEGKTFLSGYSKRFFNARYHPYKPATGADKFKQPWINQFDQEQRGEGFDPRDDYVGTLRFGYNKQQFKEIQKPLLNGEEKLPRKETPVRKLLRSIKEVKDTSGSFIDEKNTYIPWPEVYKKMSVSEIQALKFFEFDSWSEKENKIANNTLATESTVKDRYSKLSDVPKEDLRTYDDYVKPEVKVRATRIDRDFEEETPEILP